MRLGHAGPALTGIVGVSAADADSMTKTNIAARELAIDRTIFHSFLIAFPLSFVEGLPPGKPVRIMSRASSLTLLIGNKSAQGIGLMVQS
jgi:hypothetical protein